MPDLTALPSTELSRAEQLLFTGDYQAFLAQLSAKQKQVLLTKWDFWARPDQLAPRGEDWSTFVPLGGRGSGKTKAGAEFCHEQAAIPGSVGALAGATPADIRDFMIRGDSGLLATQKPWNPCEWRPSLRRVEWKNGSYALCYSGHEPEQGRGPNTDFVWADEFCKWRYPEGLWHNLTLANRRGHKRSPKKMITTTPKPFKFFREVLEKAGTIVRKVSTFRNLLNLAPEWFDEIQSIFRGTRLGRQELYADILTESDAALWKLAWIEKYRVQSHPILSRVIVGVDPPAGELTECGIVASGCNYDKTDCYTIADDSLSGTPEIWAKQVWATATKVNAHEVLAEQNQGGLMVQHTLDMARPHDCRIPVRLIPATESKAARSGPVAMLAEQGRDHHVGTFGQLEDELTNWEPTGKSPSPNRLDAKVWSVIGLDMVPSAAKRIQVL